MNLRLFSLVAIQAIAGVSFAATLVGQAPPLQISVGTPEKTASGDNRFPIKIGNVYSQAATAYVMADETYRSDNAGEFGLKALEWSDSVPGIAGGMRAIPPRSTITKAITTNQNAIRGVGILAVIYADGSTAGDSNYINELLLERRLMVDDITVALPLLRDFVADPDSVAGPAPASQLAKKMKTLETASEKQVRAVGVNPVFFDFFYSDVESDLTGFPNLDPGGRITMIRNQINLFQRALVNLRLSLPRL